MSGFDNWFREYGVIVVVIMFLVASFTIISMPFWVWEQPTEFTNNGKVCIQIDHNVYCKEELICKPNE